jgi:bifunctional non-homologous end joining protein LigD
MSLRERTAQGWALSNRVCRHPLRCRPRDRGGCFRILARRDSAGVRLITRAGNDFSSRFPVIAAAVSKLRVRSCLIDGEAIVCDKNDPLCYVRSICSSTVVFNHHYETDGERVFRAACKLSCEGIVSKRLGSLYRSGRSPNWVKVKNPKAPAVKREAEEEWGR